MSGREKAAEPKASPEGPRAGARRIGEAAKACGVTTRTLRYWQELGLLSPSGQRDGGERLYSQTDVERAARIKDLQHLLGLSLSEIRAVLDVDDVLDRLRSAYRATTRPDVQLRLLSEASAANDQLIARLDDALERIRAFRAERVQKATRMRERAREIETDAPAGRGKATT